MLAYLISRSGFQQLNPDIIRALRHKLGFDQPLIVQYFRFLGDLFTGNWGSSVSIAEEVDVWDLISDRVPLTIDLLVLPIMFGIGNYIVFGIMLGRTSNKYKGRRKDKVIQILCYFSIAIPIFFFGIILQYFLCIKLDWFPATGYKDPTYRDPEFVTGFYIIDALLAGETKKIPDYLYHLALPLFIITLTSTALIAWQTRSYLLNKSHKKSIISNTARTGITFGTIFTFIILIENIFNLYGMGKLFMDAINQLDYWLISGVLLEILIMILIITFISNLLFSLYKLYIERTAIPIQTIELIRN